ncbi:MAG: glycosyltransferase family 4 protein [Candidatus Zambryskibacteria bacterium]
MKLLVITQKVDKEDSVLGFFHGWIIEFSKKFEKVVVICLEKGEYELPGNVKVFSLGKESKKSKIKYVKNFFNLILGLHKEYDSVFVHMNQEYIVLGGFLWKVMRKKVFFWRNHPNGNIFTRVAVWFSDKVFCTSKFAFVAGYKKTSLMPVGVDIERFKDLKIERLKKSILFLSRMSPIKRPDLLIEALEILNKKNINFVCDFYGDPLPKDENYYNLLKNRVKELGLENKVSFYKSVANYETPKIYNEHNIFVNLTPTGSFDKTILEAAICGCLLVIANKFLVGEIDKKMITEKRTPGDVAKVIDFWLNANDEEKRKVSEELQKYVLENHSLDVLMNKLVKLIIV